MSGEVAAASASVFAKDRPVEDEVDGEDEVNSYRNGDGHDELVFIKFRSISKLQGMKQFRSAPIATACSTKFIPPEIVARILPRLPARSIGRFRCVCRQWRSLTRDPRFVDEHRVLGGASRMLMPSVKVCWKTTIPIYEVGPNCDEIKHISVLGKFEERGDPDVYVFSNSVNGLIGVMGVTTSDHFLINPITRDVSPLPPPPRHHDVMPCYGLGFEASRGSYKLVIVHRHPLGCSSFTVLTVGSRTCRHVGYAPLVVRSRPVFLHGAIHWLANTSDHQPELTGRWLANTSDHRPGLCILAFDVRHETLRFIPTPKILALTANHTSTSSLCLRNLEGHMCIVEASKFLQAGMRIWMLTDHTSHEWKPLYEIDISPLLNQAVADFAFDVLGILDGQVLIQSPDAIYSYDLHGRTLRTIFCGEFALGLDVVTESLVSPRGLVCMKSI